MLTRQGAQCSVGRSMDRLDALGAQLPGSFPYAADLRQEAAPRGAMVDAVRAHYGRVDVLINNAGRGLYGTPVEEIDTADLRDIFELNVTRPRCHAGSDPNHAALRVAGSS